MKIGLQGRTAIKIVSAATVVATAWMTGGMMFHNIVMEAANEKERELAETVQWDQKKVPLYAFDTKHPNNKKWAQEQQEEQNNI